MGSIRRVLSRVRGLRELPSAVKLDSFGHISPGHGPVQGFERREGTGRRVLFIFYWINLRSTDLMASCA